MLQSTPPHKGATIQRKYGFLLFVVLQSTPPHKGATRSQISRHPASGCFNPRPLTRGRPPDRGGNHENKNASIHAPSQGGDCTAALAARVALMLQSTPPHKGATRSSGIFCARSSASIHAPSQGGDHNQPPRLPLFSVLQSTPPHKGATMRTYSASA